MMKTLLGELIINLINTIKDNRTRIAINLTFIVIAVGVMIIVYFMSMQQAREILRKDHIKELNKTVKYSTEVDPKIHDILIDIRSHTGADRVFYSRYHNGGTLVGGVPFAKLSWMDETVKGGRVRLRENMQNLPMSFFMCYNSYVGIGQDLFIADISTNDVLGEEMRSLAEQNGVKSKYLFTLYDRFEDVPLGFIGIDFQTNVLLDKSDLKYIGMKRGELVQYIKHIDIDTRGN